LTRQDKVFGLGLLVYAASFFLIAVVSSVDSAITERGYACAYITLWYGWSVAKSLPHASALTLIQFFSLIVAGLINPVFLLFAIRPSKILRVCLLLMIPFSWVVLYFWQPTLYPREGHFLWVIGMILVLFSRRNWPVKLGDR
jgi:hypothetical protein